MQMHKCQPGQIGEFVHWLHPTWLNAAAASSRPNSVALHWPRQRREFRYAQLLMELEHSQNSIGCEKDLLTFGSCDFLQEVGGVFPHRAVKAQTSEERYGFADRSMKANLPAWTHCSHRATHTLQCCISTLMTAATSVMPFEGKAQFNTASLGDSSFKTF